MMITGINKIFEHEGRQLHIQAEDLGDDSAAFEIRVYNEGTVLFQKRIPYTELKEKDLDKREHEHELRLLMEKMVHTVEAGILKGKIG